MHLFDFIIRIYHDARSPERQKREITYLELILYLAILCSTSLR